MNFHGALSGSQHSEVGVRVLRVYGSFFVGGGRGKGGAGGWQHALEVTVVIA